MKTLKLKNHDIELERRYSICDFCGVINDDCVKSKKFIELPKTELRYVLKRDIYDYEMKMRFFGDTFYKISNTDIELEWIKTDVKKKIYADICYNCINQLAKIINK